MGICSHESCGGGEDGDGITCLASCGSRHKAWGQKKPQRLSDGSVSEGAMMSGGLDSQLPNPAKRLRSSLRRTSSNIGWLWGECCRLPGIYF